MKNNIRTILLMGFCLGFVVVVPVYVPLLQGHGLSMSQVLQTQALFALTIALFEVPSGYLADLWGRRRAILVGSALNAAAFFSLLWADSFADFLVYEAILGLGYSLISGTDLALLYDSEMHLQEQGLDGGAAAGRSLSRLIALETAASGAAGVVASLLLLSSLGSVVVVQAIAGFAPLLLALTLVEAPRQLGIPAGERSHTGNARRILGILLFDRPVVLWTAAAIAVFGLFAVYIFWVYQKYWQVQGVPLAWFGYLWATFALTASLAARYSAELERWLGTRALLLAIGVLPLAGVLGMAFAPGWYGVLCGFAIQLSRGLSLTLFSEALNRRVPGEFRATVNSLVSLVVRSVFIVTGPLLGAALDELGMQPTLLGLAALFAPLVALVLVPLVLRIHREKAEGREAAGNASA